MKTDFKNKIICSVDELMAEISTQEENIIYGAGGMAHILLKFLQYRGLSRFILCVTVEDDSVNPTELYGIPVVAIQYLPHFYQTANLFLAVGEELCKNVEESLQSKECRKIMKISENVFSELKELFEQIPLNFIADIGTETIRYQIEKVRRTVSWQPEVVKTNTESFANFKDINAGKNIVLLATGPTASKYKMMSDALHIGVNTTPVLNIPLDYYFAHDNRAFKKLSLDKAISGCGGEAFIGRIAGRLAHLRSEININHRQWTNVHSYFVNCPCMTEDLIRDICQHSLTDYYSIVFAAVQFALFTNPSRIYLVGCDISGKLEHFNETSNVIVSHTKYFKLGFGLLKRFVEIYYPDVEMCSINPVGLRGLFEDYYTEDEMA